jgi:hypothetical protein
MKEIFTKQLAVSLASILVMAASSTGRSQETNEVAVGPQYDSTHVYVSPNDLDAFVTSFVATFGGHASKRIVTNVLPVPSSTQSQYVTTPVGMLSVFAFETPVPFPFGLERTGYLVTDLKNAIKAARDSGAEVVHARGPSHRGLGSTDPK